MTSEIGQGDGPNGNGRVPVVVLRRFATVRSDTLEFGKLTKAASLVRGMDECVGVDGPDPSEQDIMVNNV
jgi:hypothetical protein